jgi:hypothetical protein
MGPLKRLDPGEITSEIFRFGYRKAANDPATAGVPDRVGSEENLPLPLALNLPHKRLRGSCITFNSYPMRCTVIEVPGNVKPPPSFVASDD